MKSINTMKILVFAAVFLALTASFTLYLVPAVCQMPLPTIVIQPDGSVWPSNMPISQFENTYTLTSNIFAAIKIMKSNIILNGAGHTLSGPYNGTAIGNWVIGEGPDQAAKGTADQYPIGVDLAGAKVEGVTIENLNVQNFSIGMYIWTKNNTLISNVISDNIVGVLLSGSNQTITKNYFSNNQMGLFFGFNNQNGTIPNDIAINQNGFVNNNVQLSGCGCDDPNSTEPAHNWDNGKVGNFWSDYKGVDHNGDGLGDLPYTIDVLNQDRYPLMKNPVQLMTTTPNVTIETVAVVLGIAALALIIFLVVKLGPRKR